MLHAIKSTIIWCVIMLFCVAFWIILLSTFHGCAYAASIDSDKAIAAIIGEAENQGFTGMLAVAHAIRNRGTLKGVYGSHAPRVKHHLYSARIYQLANLAWQQSGADYDITHGADHWENIKAFGCPSWVKGCIETFRYKDHVFYKEM